MTPFDRLHPALQHHVVNSLGWSELRPVQNETIAAFLDGANCVVLAPTAGGKTEAAFFPVLSQTLTESWQGLSVLYVSPIRALLNNQEERLRRYFELVGRRAACWHGDASAGDKRRILACPPDCLLTTPESLEVLLVSDKVDHRRFFAGIRAVVVDELHAFAGDDRGWHLLAVLSRIQRLCGRDVQRLGLSATVGNPAEMLDWLSAGSARSRKVVRPAPVVRATPEVQLDYVGSLANAAKVVRSVHEGRKRLVFCDSRSRVEQLAQMLREGAVETFVSHSSLSLDERRRAELAFSEGRNCVIVATSALELGLDVGDLDHVIQIDAPPSVSSFLQRMGRTGRRAGTTTNCLFLATTDEALLRAGALLDLWQEGFVEPVAAPPLPLHILSQQLMALVLQESGIGRSAWFEWVAAVPGFANAAPESVFDIVEHMIQTGVLWSDSGVLSFGPEGEAAYGRRNFMELLSVFTSPPLFRVVFGRTDLGFVHESTFYAKDDRPTVVVLAGRSWRATHVDWRRRTAYVEPAGGGGRSRWTGSGQFLTFRVCQAIQRLIAGEGRSPLWSRRAAAQFEEVRAVHPWLAPEVTALVRRSNGEVQWWNFAGGVANTLFAERLKSRIPVRGDNLSLRFSGPVEIDAVESLVASTASEDVQPIPSEVSIAALKFSECLPLHLAAETFRARFNDPAAIQATLAAPRRLVLDS